MPERPQNIPNPPRGGFATDPEAARAKREAREAAEAEAAAVAAEVRNKNRRHGLVIAGALFFGTGMYYLVVAPTVAGYGDTVNLQRLTMGETFTIVGAILSGFAWRPKA